MATNVHPRTLWHADVVDMTDDTIPDTVAVTFAPKVVAIWLSNSDATPADDSVTLSEKVVAVTPSVNGIDVTSMKPSSRPFVHDRVNVAPPVANVAVLRAATKVPYVPLPLSRFVVSHTSSSLAAVAVMDRVILTAVAVGNAGMVGVSVVLVRVWSSFRLSFR